MFKKNNVVFKPFSRCRDIESKESQQNLVTVAKLSFDSGSQKILNEAIKTLIKNKDKDCEVVLPGIVNKQTGEVTLTFTTRRPDSKAITKSHWKKITPFDPEKLYPDNPIVDNEIGSIYCMIFDESKIGPQTHIQVIYKKINDSHEEKSDKVVTIEDMLKFSGFTITMFLNNNKLVVEIDGKSRSLNVDAIVISHVMKRFQDENNIDRDELHQKIDKKLDQAYKFAHESRATSLKFSHQNFM